jgi:sterol desaturase/sphingolipid hydroxylase (fatty acid hydroxylase superfamily)
MESLKLFKFGVGDYAFYLLLISLVCFGLERAFPWRKEQRALRKGFGQDVFWLVFHGHILGIVTWQVGNKLNLPQYLPPYQSLRGAVDALKLVSAMPWWGQALVLLVVKDFFDWCTHNLLHRVPFLWQFHKQHHTIEELDFLGNFRFHWAEVTVYWFVTSLPIASLGVWQPAAWMSMAVISTAIGHLNHSNVRFDYGPLRYVFNSPRMHVWHHEYLGPGEKGCNYAIVFSAWDWLFRTARMPEGQPARLGFAGMESFPGGVLSRLAWPLSALWSRQKPKASSA